MGQHQDVPCQLADLAQARGVLDILIFKHRHGCGRSRPLASTLRSGHRPLNSVPGLLVSTSLMFHSCISGCHGLILLWLPWGSDLKGKLVTLRGVQMQSGCCDADTAQSLESPGSWRPARLESVLKGSKHHSSTSPACWHFVEVPGWTAGDKTGGGPTPHWEHWPRSPSRSRLCFCVLAPASCMLSLLYAIAPQACASPGAPGCASPSPRWQAAFPAACTTPCSALPPHVLAPGLTLHNPATVFREC